MIKVVVCVHCIFGYMYMYMYDYNGRNRLGAHKEIMRMTIHIHTLYVYYKCIKSEVYVVNRFSSL